MAENSHLNNREAGSQPSFEIPKQTERKPEVGIEKARERDIEQRQISEGGALKQTPQFQTPAPVSVVPDPSSAQPVSTLPPISQGLSAHDADLIEKQWVDRAKAIVAKTQDDPYKQKSEMSRIKAEYIKKRFNKTIPVEGSSKS